MLEVRDLTKVYTTKKGQPVLALDHVNLKFEETGMVFVLGKSGSGKSTFLNLVGGLDTITEGEVVIKGKTSKDFSQSDFDSYRNTFIGFIFQEYNILNEFTVGKNIALALQLQGKKADKAAVDDILEQVDLAGYADRKPNELSGGQKQRVAIARALIKDPEIIMADEPTGALDSNTGKQVFETLKKLAERKLVIIVSHDRDYAEFYGNRVIEFADGKVISDIKKYTAESHAVSDGVSIVDDSVIHVKPGHKLTENEKQTILKFLDNSENELILSKDVKSNKDFRRFARIDDEGNKESFEKTSEKNQHMKQYDGSQLKLMRSRLPIRHSTKIAASSLKVKPFRLFLTVLLSAISFGLFGLADTVGAYNKYDVTYNSMIESNISYASFSKRVTEIPEKEGYWAPTSYPGLDDDDIKALSEKFPDNVFDKIYASSSLAGLSYSGLIPSGSSGAEATFYRGGGYGQSGGVNGIVYMPDNDDSFFAKRKMTLVGSYPAADDEIVIPEYLYYRYRDFGFDSSAVGLDSIPSLKIPKGKEMSDFLAGNPFILLNRDMLKITGIAKTGFDEERYKSLKETNLEWSILTQALSMEFSGVLENSYHGSFFMRQGVVADTDSGNYIGSESGLIVNFGMGHADAIADETYAGGITFFEVGKTKLSANEVAIPFSMAMELSGDSHYYETQFESMVKPSMYDAAALQAYLQDASTPGDIKSIWCDAVYGRYNNHYDNSDTILADSSYYSDPSCYGLFLQTLQSINGYQDLKPGGNNYTDILVKIVAENLKTATHPIYMYNQNGGKDQIEKTVKVAGVLSSSEKPISDYIIIFSDSEYQNIISQLNANTSAVSGIITALSGDKSKDMKLIRFSYEETANADGKTTTAYPLSNAVSFALDNINDMIEIMAQVFLYVGIGFAVFAALLLANFITISIANKKREIGILRAIGARSSDVFRIFFTESLIIALISFLIGTIGCGIGAFFLNRVLRTELGLLIQVLTFSIRQIGLILLVSVAVALVASFLPVFFAARKKPIETIRRA